MAGEVTLTGVGVSLVAGVTLTPTTAQMPVHGESLYGLGGPSIIPPAAPPGGQSEPVPIIF